MGHSFKEPNSQRNSSFHIPLVFALTLLAVTGCGGGSDGSGTSGGGGSGSSDVDTANQDAVADSNEGSPSDSCFYNTLRSNCEDIAENYFVTSFLSGSGNQCPSYLTGFDAQATGDVGTCIFDGSQSVPPGGLDNFDSQTSGVIPNPQNFQCGVNSPNYILELADHPVWQPNENGQIHFRIFTDETLEPSNVWTVNSVFGSNGEFINAGSLDVLSRVAINDWNGAGSVEDFITYEYVGLESEANLVLEWARNIDFTSDSTIANARITRTNSAGYSSRGVIRFNVENIQEHLLEAASLPSSILQISAFMDAVTTHELGHILGVSPHPSRSNTESIMAPLLRGVGRYYVGRGRDALSATDLDLRTLRELYCSEYK